jgi:hypothetical protein
MEIEVSIGEIVDKLSILDIKIKNIKDVDKLKNIEKEFNYLNDIVFNQLKIDEIDYHRLVDINTKLWIIEDDIREKERSSEFDEDFVKLARAVYFTNDDRSVIKKDINLKYGSDFIEEKSYSDYKK